MKLDEYLKCLEECPDELFIDRKEVLEGKKKLFIGEYAFEKEFGIGDNWPVLLSIDYNELIKDLQESLTSDKFFSGQYKLWKTNSWKDNDPKWPGLSMPEGIINNIFEYVRGAVKIQARNEVCEDHCIYDDPDYIHQQRQLKEFNVSILVHPYGKEIEGMSKQKALALVIADIGKYAQKKGISLCFPYSVGTNYKDDFSKIVYFDPKK
jgi:hypothetical protein